MGNRRGRRPTAAGTAIVAAMALIGIGTSPLVSPPTSWASAPVGSGPETPGPQPAFYTYQAPGGGWTAGRRVIALTFDDGPGPATPQILSILQQYQVPATFFEIGEEAAEYPQYTRMVAAAGYPVENHTWSHPDLTTIPVSQFPYQIDQTQNEIRALTGQTPRCVRPPYDTWDATVLDQIADRGLTTMSYSVDPQDWSLPGVAAIVSRVVGAAFPGAVVDLHDGGGPRAETAAALPEIITDLRVAGYTFVSICGSSVPSATHSSTVGWYNQTDGSFHLLPRNASGFPTNAFVGGPPGDHTVIPLEGDWTGSGVDTVGWYRPADGSFHLLLANAYGAGTISFVGAPAGANDVYPVVGDWTGSGVDTVGWYRQADGSFHLLLANAYGARTIAFVGGPRGPGGFPVAGDWTGRGVDTVGWYRPADGSFHLLLANAYGAGTIPFVGAPAGANDVYPVVGDWTGSGVDTVGWYRQADGSFHLLLANAYGAGTIAFVGGPAGAAAVRPVAAP